MAISSEYVMGEQMVEVGLAEKFQASVRGSKVLSFEKNPTLEFKILKANPSDILVVISTLTSPKQVMSVESYDELLSKSVF
jgi:hypothetical protein